MNACAHACRDEELQAKAHDPKNANSGEEDELVCPITGELFEDPVICMDGHTYERTAIEEWLELHATSPRTNLDLESKMLIPNHQMRSLCDERRARLGRVMPAAAAAVDADGNGAGGTPLRPVPEDAALRSLDPSSPLIANSPVCVSEDVTISQLQPAACDNQRLWTKDKDVAAANEIACRLGADPTAYIVMAYIVMACIYSYVLYSDVILVMVL